MELSEASLAVRVQRQRDGGGTDLSSLAEPSQTVYANMLGLFGASYMPEGSDNQREV